MQTPYRAAGRAAGVACGSGVFGARLMANSIDVEGKRAQGVLVCDWLNSLTRWPT